jgi:hypothetical protein
MNALPSIVSFLSVACGISMLTLAALVQSPVPQDNPKMLHECMKIRPERYCRLTHAPSTVRAMDKR